MYNLTIRFFMSSLIFLAAVKNSAGQNMPADSISDRAYHNITANFYNAIGHQSRLYNGPEYRFHPYTIKGTAYFDDIKNWQTGSVTYDSVYYDNVRLMYDAYLDLAVVLLYNDYSMFSLLSERLESFTMGTSHFINIRAGNNLPDLSPGIYSLLYEGKLQVLGKQIKLLETSPSTTERSFRPSKRFYIRKNNTYNRISNESGALNVLKDKKKELKAYIKKNNIKFRKNPEQAMTMIAGEYDRLTN